MQIKFYRIVTDGDSKVVPVGGSAGAKDQKYNILYTEG
jgi:hypothetical protein